MERAAGRSGAASRKAATAARASGDGRPPRAWRIAPAPIRSSTAGRRLPSGRRSPAATTPTGRPRSRAAAATAEALRRHPASTTAPASARARLTVAPFGEASPTRVPAGTPRRDTGESEERGGPAPSGPPRTGHRPGMTWAPLLVATSTAVVKRRMSTTTRTGQRGPGGCRLPMPRRGGGRSLPGPRLSWLPPGLVPWSGRVSCSGRVDPPILVGLWAQARGAPTPKASSSIGRVPVSKTGGWGFESLLACHPSTIDRRLGVRSNPSQ